MELQTIVDRPSKNPENLCANVFLSDKQEMRIFRAKLRMSNTCFYCARRYTVFISERFDHWMWLFSLSAEYLQKLS